MELEITWGRAIKVWWSYLWRNLIAIVVAMLIAGIVGFILGFVLFAIGAAEETIKMISAPIGGLIGVLISIIPMKMILGKDFGEFRLMLVKNENNT